MLSTLSSFLKYRIIFIVSILYCFVTSVLFAHSTIFIILNTTILTFSTLLVGSLWKERDDWKRIAMDEHRSRFTSRQSMVKKELEKLEL